MEELRQRDANLTALQAIGPRKKPKLEEGTATPVAVSNSIVRSFWPWSSNRNSISFQPGASGVGVGVSGKAATPLRPRIKRVNLRDMLFYLEQEKESCRSQMLYKAYLKWSFVVVRQHKVITMMTVVLCWNRAFPHALRMEPTQVRTNHRYLFISQRKGFTLNPMATVPFSGTHVQKENGPIQMRFMLRAGLKSGGSESIVV